MTSRSPFLLGLIASLLLAAAACDTVEPGNEGEGGGGGGGGAAEPGTCAADGCGSTEAEVDHCSFGEVCREVDLCGLTIYCQKFCSAVAECDDGDDPLTEGSCPEGSACYMVEACGTTIQCIDHGQQHGCPDEAPAEAEPCNWYGISCTYPNRALACAETWRCQEPPKIGAPIVIDPYVWHLVESDCAEP